MAKRIVRNEDKKNRLLLAYSEGVYTLEELKRQKDDIESDIAKAQGEKNTLANKLNASSADVPQRIDLKAFSERIKTLVKKLDPSKKQKALQYFIRQILLDGDTATVSAVLPREILVVPTSTLS